MLSRVADNLYWLARYLERAENLARLVDVNASLMLDLPKELAPGWQPVITITGSQAIFNERYKDTSERSVVRFVVADEKNPGSMVSSLASAREIARTIRDILPREVWEHVNELFLYVNEHAVEAINKRTRYAFLKRVTLGTQTFTGMLEGIVNEGASLAFLALGRNLERADMTSRIVDVRAAAMLPDATAPGLRPFATVQWMSVLSSLSGYHMYRLKMRERVHPAGVVRFLLADDEFPRACVCCLKRAEQVLNGLPNSEPVLKRLSRMRRAMSRTPFETMNQEALHEFIDRWQLALARTNDELTRVYFLGELAPTLADAQRASKRTASQAQSQSALPV
jgi:uncharacterized alpha-E superfamily protein